MADRFDREVAALKPLPAQRYDTAYRDMRQVSWDADMEVRGRRYSVPCHLAGQPVHIRLTLEGELTVYAADHLVARHLTAPGAGGWQTVPAHHAPLWAKTLTVEHRPRTVSDEVAAWS